MSVNESQVFQDIGFSNEEAANLKVRSMLMQNISDYVKAENITQAEAAQRFNVSQPRVSDLIRGKINLFTVDMLIKMLIRVGYDVSFSVNRKEDPEVEVSNG